MTTPLSVVEFDSGHRVFEVMEGKLFTVTLSANSTVSAEWAQFVTRPVCSLATSGLKARIETGVNYTS